MAEVMKPCPFCGGAANLRDYDYPRKPVFIDCDPCNLVIEGDDGTVESAIAAWNLRAPDPERDELREALRLVMDDISIASKATNKIAENIAGALADKGVR